MEQGWIKIHRTIIDKGWFQDSNAVHLWFYLLLKASHSKSEYLWNGQIIDLQPGQFVTGRKKIANETGIQESKIERLLKLFESEQQIEQRKTNTSRLISIINYKKFQSNEQPFEQRVNNKRTTSEQRVNTNKELKELKELKNDNYKDSLNPLLIFIFENCPNIQKMSQPMTETEANKLMDAFQFQEITEILVSMDNYKKLNTSYQSPFKTCLNWLKRAKNDKPNNNKPTKIDWTDAIRKW
jgi:hypothetical protein